MMMMSGGQPVPGLYRVPAIMDSDARGDTSGLPAMAGSNDLCPP